MENKGLSLIEVILALVISGIVILAMTCQFIAETRFRGTLKDDFATIEEADVAMYSMSRAMRFAYPANITATSGTLNAYIEGGHIQPFNMDDPDTPVEVTYQLNSTTHTVDYTLGANSPMALIRNVTKFEPEFNSTTNTTTITLTVEKGNKKIPLRTKIKTLIVQDTSG